MWPSAVAMGVASVLWYATSLNSFLLAALTAAVYIYFGGSLTIWQIYRTLPRDLRLFKKLIWLQYRMTRVQWSNRCVPRLFQEVVRNNTGKVAYYFEDQKWTFDEVEALSNQVAHYFAGQGIHHGDAVALFMENRVQYICIWLGLTKLGAVPALINYNLRQDPLLHCISVVSCKAVVCGAELQDALADIRNEYISKLPVYVSGMGKVTLQYQDGIDLDSGLLSCPTTSPPQLANVSFTDNMVYIYTSGTTGLPKAAIIKHSRGALVIIAGATMFDLTPDDVIYCPMPLYHLAAGLLGAGQALLSGVPVVIRRRFSASAYWSDCAKYQCTAGQYIGEICRYLLNMPEKPEDTQHQLRIMFGNGLRPDIWKDFEKRFKIPLICEAYSATEGNATVVNIDGKPGSIGFVSVLLPFVYPVALLKVNEETRELVRDDNGLCIRCKPGEPGEFVGKIVKNNPLRDFHGYLDKIATKKKVARDVFTKGDHVFLTGDILVMDDEGYLYFKDRTGDTFRWKGENVSTGEVEAIVSRAAGQTDVVVYGVEVPRTDGRAGMAAVLDQTGSVDLNGIYSGVCRSLPSYARPLFLRLVKKLEMTGTYKLRKVTLQKEGFNPNTVMDPLYFLDNQQKAYVALTPDLYNRIVTGDVRV